MMLMTVEKRIRKITQTVKIRSNKVYRNTNHHYYCYSSFDMNAADVYLSGELADLGLVVL